MKGDRQVLVELNKILKNELTSINQFFLHARMYNNWGFEVLNEKAYKKSIKDMKQSDEIINRILFLEGLPNLQDLGKLHIGEHTEEMIECDSQIQLAQIAQLKDSIKVCEDLKDFTSRELLKSILAYEEDYLDWLETQQHLIETLSIEKYLQSQIHDDD
ncbi:bacterioferritin [Reinekea thalattae]|uniref:Bacterioferritin n=1 Tax=Reinekea thalattae TaxID=2593301 RepID=A0A5C8Z555_9GAMM|nr:bacterioferritin [Reinekea thalattae]TXR53245.1 bacterioferritin [Reinekea thalattae]